MTVFWASETWQLITYRQGHPAVMDLRHGSVTVKEKASWGILDINEPIELGECRGTLIGLLVVQIQFSAQLVPGRSKGARSGSGFFGLEFVPRSSDDNMQ